MQTRKKSRNIYGLLDGLKYSIDNIKTKLQSIHIVEDKIISSDDERREIASDIINDMISIFDKTHLEQLIIENLKLEIDRKYILNIFDINEKNKEKNKNKKVCKYIFKRGKNKNKMCGKFTKKDEDFCSTHIKKSGNKKEMDNEKDILMKMELDDLKAKAKELKIPKYKKMEQEILVDKIIEVRKYQKKANINLTTEEEDETIKKIKKMKVKELKDEAIKRGISCGGLKKAVLQDKIINNINTKSKVKMDDELSENESEIEVEQDIEKKDEEVDNTDFLDNDPQDIYNEEYDEEENEENEIFRYSNDNDSEEEDDHESD